MNQLTDTISHHPENSMALPLSVRELYGEMYEIIDANGSSVEAFGWMQDHIAHVINTSSDLRLEGVISQPVVVTGDNEWNIVDAGGNYLDESLEASELIVSLVNSYGGITA